MLVDFFFKLREYQLPVSLRELLDLLNAMKQGVIFANLNDFYLLSRTILIKDESHFDKFDRAFADYFEGVQSIDLFGKDIPDEWLRAEIERHFSEEEKAQIKAMGGRLLRALWIRLKRSMAYPN